MTPTFSSVTELCPTLWDPMDCSTSWFSVNHQLPELTQTHVRGVSDAIQSLHPLSSPSPSALQSSQHQVFSMSQFFSSGGQSIGVSASASVLPMNIQDWFPLGLTSLISLPSKGLSRVFSNTTVQGLMNLGLPPLLLEVSLHLALCVTWGPPLWVRLPWVQPWNSPELDISPRLSASFSTVLINIARLKCISLLSLHHFSPQRNLQCLAYQVSLGSFLTRGGPSLPSTPPRHLSFLVLSIYFPLLLSVSCTSSACKL